MCFPRAKLGHFVWLVWGMGFLGTAFLGAGLADTLPPIWMPATGTAITSWNDVTDGNGFYTLSLPFEFNFLGNSYTSATLASNGLIYFSPPSVNPPTTPQPQPYPNPGSLFTQGSWPLIAPAWYDIQAISGSGSILVDTMQNQVVITYLDVASYVPPSGPVPASDLATFQVTLDSNGTIIFAYSALNSVGANNTLVGSDEAIAGVTGARGASDPGSLDLSVLADTAGFRYNSSGSTVYQAIDNNPGDNSNLAGLDLIFTPQAGLTWQVTSEYAGQPAPEPATLFEMAVAALPLMLWRRYKRGLSGGSL
jgi:hypothetical protein